MRESERIETLRPFGTSAEPGRTRRRGAFAAAHVESDPPAHAPRGVGEILDLALEILRARFATFVGLCALLWIPVRLMQPFFGQHVFVESSDPTAALGLLFSVAVAAVGATVLHAFASVAVALVVFAVLRGEKLSAAGALRIAMRRLFGVLLIAMVSGIAAGVGALLCLVPTVYFSWKLALAPSVYVLERADVAESLRRSFRLTSGSFLRWLAIVVVLFFLVSPLNALGAIVDNADARSAVIENLALSPTVFDAVGVGLTALFLGLATSITAVVITVLYLDCRVRRDGDDLWRRLEALRASGPAQPTGAG